MNLLSFIYTFFNKRLIFVGFNFSFFNVFFKLKGYTTLGTNCKFRSGVLLNTSPQGKLNIGDNFFANRGCSINAHASISIGDNVQLGENVLIYDHDHEFKSGVGIITDKYICSPVSIGDNCWIGSNTVILKGVSIGSGVIVAAGSVVTKSIDNDCLYLEKKNRICKGI